MANYRLCGRGHACGFGLGWRVKETSPECPRGAPWLREEAAEKKTTIGFAAGVLTPRPCVFRFLTLGGKLRFDPAIDARIEDV